MLFDLINDHHYIDLVDENDKVFRRFKSETQYKEWASRFSPEDLKGLVRKDFFEHWYESTFEISKLLFFLIFVCYILYILVQGLFF